jgi:DNA-binding MarR family transcriptional regulator
VSGLREGGFLISKIHQLAGRIFNRMLKEHRIEINRAQGRIIFVLWQEDEIPIRKLAEKTALQKSTLTSMLDRLEESGFIQRIPSKEDRREIRIKRTAKDRAFQKQYVQVSRDMIQLFYAGFSSEEIDGFEEQLRRILHNLEGYEKMAPA